MASQEELDREQELLRLTQQRAGIQEDILEDVRDIGNVISDQLKNLRFERQERTEIRSLVREVNKTASENYNTTLKDLGSQKQLAKIAKDRNNLATQLLSLQNLQQKFAQGTTEEEKNMAFALKEQIIFTQNLVNNLDQIESQSRAIANNFSVKTFEGLNKVVKDIPILRQFAAPFEAAANASRITVAENTKILAKRKSIDEVLSKSLRGVTDGKLKELGFDNISGKNKRKQLEDLKSSLKVQNETLAGTKELSSTFSKMASAAILGSIVNSFLQLNKAQTDIRRNLGESVKSLDLIDTKFGTQVDQLQTINSLTEQFGFNTIAAFDAINLREATELTVAMGLSAEEAGMLAFNAQVSGKNLSLAVDQAIKGVSPLLSQRKILQEITKLSPSITLAFKNNNVELAKAASNAKLLGLNLTQVDKVAEGLLDIEQSLTAEFEAEVITGKQLNLERARFFALTNQTAELTKEIGKNQEIINTFATGSRIEQSAIADSLGLSRDELAKMVQEQKVLSTMSAAQIKEKEEADFKRQTAQQTLNDSIAKMGEALAGPVELMADFLVSIKSVLPIIAGIVLATKAYSAATAAVVAVQSILNRKKTQQLATEGAIATVGAISNPVRAAAGIAAASLVAGLVGGYMLKGDDIMSPGEGSSGYGKRTLLGPEGAIALNNKDTVIAGTKLFPSQENNTTINNTNNRNSSQNVTVTLSKEDIKSIADAVKDGASKANINVNLDGNRVSNSLQTPLAMNTRRYSV